MLHKLPLYLALLTLTQCSQCKRDDPQPQPPKDPLSLLPPETQTGTGTFACLVNGKAFIALYTTSANGDWQSFNRLVIGGTMRLNGDPVAQALSITSALNGQLQSVQAFSIVSSATPFPIFTPGVNQFITTVTGYTPCYYSGNNIKAGQVTLVKFDPVARIAAGRFAFVLYEPGGCDTLRVSNGRFDVKF